jgi:1-acyl-sn-glycerol-3-phosphate acyltransferase
MVLLFFFIISAAASVAFALLSAGVNGFADIWKPIVFCLCCFIGLVVVYLLIAAIVSLFIDKNRPISRKSDICSLFCYMAGSIVCSVTGIKPHLSGFEKIPGDKRFLLISNHRSGYDPLFMLNILRKYDVAFVSKPSNMALPVVGSVAHGAGCLSLNRENNREALKTIITASEYMLKDLCSMCIYPEGTRSKTGDLGPFHAGSFKIAQKAKAPVVIEAISGTEKVKKGLLKGRNDVSFDVLDIIPAEKVCSLKTVELAEYSRNIILKHLGH